MKRQQLDPCLDVGFHYHCHCKNSFCFSPCTLLEHLGSKSSIRVASLINDCDCAHLVYYPYSQTSLMNRVGGLPFVFIFEGYALFESFQYSTVFVPALAALFWMLIQPQRHQ